MLCAGIQGQRVDLPGVGGAVPQTAPIPCSDLLLRIAQLKTSPRIRRVNQGKRHGLTVS